MISKVEERKCLKEKNGITLIALIITIVLNCWRSGRNKENKLLKNIKMIIKNDVIVENT